MDDTARAVMQRVRAVPVKPSYDRTDIEALVQADSRKVFEVALLCVGLFLGLSKDQLAVELRQRLGKGAGIKRFQTDPQTFLAVLDDLGLADAMTRAINVQPVWSDILEERLRSGRGSAIRGQQRGRDLENFVEGTIRSVFGPDGYALRCSFQGPRGLAKCDVAIPDRTEPRILVESKGYGATGSKMTDIIGDLDAIIAAKRHDTSLLIVTDGLTWKHRLNDLRKILDRQNDGRITRVYTKLMSDQFEDDLRTLKDEYRI